jgi:hypothetical protein
MKGMTIATRHSLFGLKVLSELSLPGLEAEGWMDAPDVWVTIGAIPAKPVGPGKILSFEGAGQYWVSGGERIVVEPENGADPANIRLYLLGSAFGMLLHQRGLFPLHANAIAIDGRAYAFTGASGSGKSTLAALFHDAGFPVLADDVCVIGIDGDGQPVAAPGIPRLRMWEDAIAATGRVASDYQLSFAGDDSFRKFDVPLAPVDTGAYPVGAIYLLVQASEVRIQQLRGVAAADTLFANTYRGALVKTDGKPENHWNLVLRLIQKVPVFRFERPWNLGDAAGALDLLVAHTRSIDQV